MPHLKKHVRVRDGAGIRATLEYTGKMPEKYTDTYGITWFPCPNTPEQKLEQILEASDAVYNDAVHAVAQR